MALYLLRDNDGEGFFSDKGQHYFTQPDFDRAIQAMAGIEGFVLAPDQPGTTFRGQERGQDTPMVGFPPEMHQVQLQNVPDDICKKLIGVLNPRYFLDDECRKDDQSPLIPVPGFRQRPD